MAYVHRNWCTFAGIRSTSNARYCTYADSRMAALPRHPLTGRELRALRRLQREQELKSPFVFTSERGTPFTKRGFQAMVERAGKAKGFDVKIHPHMLRHACGFKLANDGVDTGTIQVYLGHKSIQHYRALHRAGAYAVQKLIPGLTAPCSGFEIKKGDPSFSSFKIVKS
jgi:integrase